MHAIEARQLVRKFGEVTAVAGVDFAVAQGEVFGLFHHDRGGVHRGTSSTPVSGRLPARLRSQPVWTRVGVILS